MRAPIAVLACLLALPAWAEGRTIVGEWAPSRDACGTPAAYRIGPRQIVADELSCVFDGVSRKGETVTFAGRCSDGSESTPETVVATRSGDHLALRFAKGGGEAALVACPPGNGSSRRLRGPAR